MILQRLAVFGLVFAVTGSAGAQDTIYHWTDERGVVHFADSPPPNRRNVTSRVMPPPPTRASTPASGDAAAAPAGSTTPGGSTTPAAAAPARVEIVGQQGERVGESAQVISGRVKNNGGQPANNVVVALRVVSPAQGDECLTDEVVVAPSTLAPEAEGTFDVELSSPCFKGETRIELQVDWD